MQLLNMAELDWGIGTLEVFAPLALLLVLTTALATACAVNGLHRKRRVTDAGLRASEAMLERACRLGGVGGWELDLATRQLRWSRQTCVIHDVAPEFQPTFEQGLGFYSGSGRQTLAAAVQRAAAEGRPWDLELPLTTASGRSIWVRVVGEVMPAAAPKAANEPVRRLAGSIQDVTARRALEDAMRRSHTVLRGVVDNLPCGLSVFDAQLSLTAHNDEFIRLLDLPASFFEGRPPTFDSFVAFNLAREEYGPGVEGERAAQRLRGFTDQPKPMIYERVRPNGTVIDVRAAPMPGGGFILIYSDITERRLAQAEISRSEQLLRGAMDSIDEAFALFDPQDRIVYVNEKYRSSYADVIDVIKPGTRFEDLVRARLAANPTHRAWQHPAGIEAWVAQRIALHRKGDTRMVQHLEDGRWVRVIERMMPDGHIVGLRIDISDLMRATDAAEKASVAKGQFLANMSHEIRTPMNAVLGMLKLLQRTPMTARQRDYVSKSEGAARSLLCLLNDILDFSKVEAGKMTLDLQPVLLDGLLRDLSVILALTVDDKPGVALHFDIDPELPRCVVADAQRLLQVLINLGGNAVKFTDNGDVRVQLKLHSRTPEAVQLEVAVSDTGIGIAPEHQASIFTGFTQAEAATSRRYGGTGLGLAISQRLVQLMGAELKLDSVLGRGSRFHFSLHLALPPDAAAQGLLDAHLDATMTATEALDDTTALLAPLPPLPPSLLSQAGGVRLVQPIQPVQPVQPLQPGRLQGLRLLVVEDNLNNQQVARELLEDEGARVSVASDGQQALTQLAQGKRGGLFDAVLMDVQMPVMDGYTATRLIRRQLKLKLPIIAMTANALQVDQQVCLDVGMDEHVGKPFDLEHLVRVLLRHCGIRAASGATLVDSPGPARRQQPRNLPAALLLQADAAGIALAEALARMSGKSDLFVRMAAALSEEAAELPTPLTAPALHRVRGLASTLGARTLATLAAQGERLLKAGQPMAEGWQANFAAAVQSDLTALTALARQLHVDEATAPLAESSGASTLGALIDLLRGADMAALAAYAQLRPGLLATHPAQVSLLDAALDRLAFDEAAALCHGLREPQLSSA